MFIACSGDTGTSPQLSFEGTFIGTYTATTEPGVIFQAILQLTPINGGVTGTLTTNAGRAARVNGSISGSRLTMTGVYTDGCQGIFTSTADVTSDGSRLVGNYSTTDCIGSYSGGYSLDRE